jgi:hypothetical protein
MASKVPHELADVLSKIDRPGSFCASGSAPAVLPGLEVEGLGPIALPLTARQAKELKKHCEQAPYGKGEQTVVDTSVRRVRHLTPERFALTNPDWEKFLEQTVKKVQLELGLEKRKLEAHLYDLLLYEPGSFFLPHRDGEKLDGMVATLVVVLPSSFQGGELVVRHEGQEQTIDQGGRDEDQYRIHYAAFYADCEHEIRPLRAGYRLCLVYNLTLKKGKKGLGAPRRSEYVEQASQVLRDWAQDDEAHKLVVTLEHQYTKDGLTIDTLKGADRAKAEVLFEAGRLADCQVLLALLTLHQSGSAEGGYGGGYYGRRGRWYDDYDEEEEEEDVSDYEMGEIYDSSLTAEHFSDSQGHRLAIGEMDVEEEELLDPEALEDIDPEEEFEGYTGNAGMTLDRWYRHAAIFIWPERKHFEVLCDAGIQSAVGGLQVLVKKWQQAGKKAGAALREECRAFAAAILARWPENRHVGYGEKAETCPLLQALVKLDDPELIRTYLVQVLARDAARDPGAALGRACQKHGWGTFGKEIAAVFEGTTEQTLERNVRLLERLCLAKPRKDEGWAELCGVLANTLVSALERIDNGRTQPGYWGATATRAKELTGLARSLLAAQQPELLSRLVEHALATPKKYPLTEAHIAALTALGPWIEKNVRKASPGLSHWLAACCEQLEALTAEMPQPYPDFRRPSKLSCSCADCAELKKFLNDRQEQTHGFKMGESRRQHLAAIIRQDHCDVDQRTDTRSRPHTLVCTKNSASYHANLKKYHQDQEHLKALRAIEASLPK